VTFVRTLRLPADRSVLLLGPRQTGKSTLVRGALESGAFAIDLLEHDTFLRYAKEPGRFRAEAEAKIARGARTVFVDEVQKIPALLDEAHALIERHRVRMLLTGSSARKLKRGASNLLGGRARVAHLHPLTHAELGRAFSLERVLRLGSLPAVCTETDEAAIDLLRSYADTYLREEIQAEALVRNIGSFARFLDVAAAQVGEPVNFTAVSRDVGAAARTVQEYYQVLEDTLLGFRLEPWRKSPRARMVGHPRFYFFDTGVVNALRRRITAEPDPEWRGRLFEQWVIGETRRVLDYRRSEARLWFFRTHNGAEVDLLLEKHDRLQLAIEIKSGRRIAGADLSGLRSFREAHPSVPALVVAPCREPYRVADVDVVPIGEYLARLEEL
jgi:predicted AAA+ superfamily ATPase